MTLSVSSGAPSSSRPRIQVTSLDFLKISASERTNASVVLLGSSASAAKGVSAEDDDLRTDQPRSDCYATWVPREIGGPKAMFNLET